MVALLRKVISKVVLEVDDNGMNVEEVKLHEYNTNVTCLQSRIENSLENYLLTESCERMIVFY
jgi:hypothetical protein